MGIKETNPPQLIKTQRAPGATDMHYEIGDIWINESSNISYQLVSKTGGTATWSVLSPGASDVDTINGLAPVGGDILIAGGTNLTDVNAGNTVTLNLDDAITVATSVTCPLYTSAAGVDTAVTAPAGQNIVIQMGDAAGANKVSFVDSAAVEQFAIDSNGGIGTLAGLTVAGALTQTAGVVNIGQDNAGNAVNIAGGNVARAVGIANSAAAHTVTLGSTTGAASLALQSGTGNITASSAGTLLLDSAGVLEINSSAGVIGIGNDAVAQNINVGTGGAARTITVGNITGATAVNINTGTGGSTYTTTNGTFALNTGTGAINVGTDAAAKTITVGNGTGATSVVVDCGTGALNIGTNAVAHTTTIGNATGASSVVLDVGTGNLDLGVTATAHTSRLGSTAGASATTVQCGTGAMTVNGGGILDIDAVGQLQINSSGSTIDIGNDAVAQNMNIGTGAAARTITLGNTTGASSVVVDVGTGAASFGASATAHTTTVGSTTGASALVLQSGTGDITVTGTVKEIDAEFLYASGDEITFQSNPLCQKADGTFAVPAGATGEVDRLYFQEGVSMEQFIIGAGQTILAPDMDANGLLASLDLMVAEGVEYNFGAARLNSRHAFTIGTSPAFFFQLRFRINDMDGADPYIFGFRKSEANNATWENYTDFAAIGMNAVTTATQIVTATELNSGGTTITNTTDLWGGDGTTNTLTVLVSAAGVVTYLINGAAPTVPAAFTFDNGDVVVPFIRIEHSASPTAVNFISMKIGYQA